MQIVRLLLAGIAVIFGLIFTLTVAVVGMLIFTINRLLGRSGAKASFNVNFQRGRPTPASEATPRATRISRDGAIDIEATEVKN
ncbi:MAG: hypothetical protein ABW223_12365 [Rariglobus sp.]